MMHEKRRFGVADVATAEALAEKLVEHTWTTCTGFRFGGHLYLNDSTSPDGAQEFAVVRESDMVQVESITFSWCSLEKALDYIQRIDRGELGGSYGTISNKVEASKEHGTCSRCA